MRDSISIQRIDKLHPKFRGDAKNFIEEAEEALNLTIRVVQGIRSFKEQNDLYAQGRTKPGAIVTYSPAGTSYHNYGLALDACPFLPDSIVLNWKFDFNILVPFAEKYGMTCGIKFPHRDSDHFENKYGHNWRDLLHLYKTKNFIPGTTYVNI